MSNRVQRNAISDGLSARDFEALQFGSNCFQIVVIVRVDWMNVNLALTCELCIIRLMDQNLAASIVSYDLTNYVIANFKLF